MPKNFGQKENVFQIKVMLPDGSIKSFRTDEWNEEITIKRFQARYGNIFVERTQIE